MKLRPLILDDVTRKRIAEVVAYAEANRVSLRTIMEITDKPGVAIGDDVNRRCVIPLGYRCVFSIDQQPNFWMRHISISVDGDGVAPSIAAVRAICHEFGFRHELSDGPQTKPPWPFCVYTEKLTHRDKVAINVMEALE